MNNLINGTAKHIMKNVWLDPEKPLLDKNTLQQIQEKMDKLKVPACMGRIQNSYRVFTADQWKSFTIFFPYMHCEMSCHTVTLKCGIILLVLTCALLFSQKQKHCLLTPLKFEPLKFCQSFEQLYGKHRVTPNIHLHTHLVESILDYGPVYLFWLFSFERYNGTLGEYGMR